MSSNNQVTNGLSFFDLPAEIRQIIYHYATAQNPRTVNLIEILNRRDPDRDEDEGISVYYSLFHSLNRSMEPPRPGEPSVHNLASTCRQVELELDRSSFYRNNRFRAEDIPTLTAFIADTHAVHLQAIEELELLHFGQMKGKVGGVKSTRMDDRTNHPRFENIMARNMVLLKPFRNLKVLIFADTRILCRVPELMSLWVHPSRRLFRSLVKYCWTLESLQTIKMYSTVDITVYHRLRDVGSDSNDIPGWTYSIEKDDGKSHVTNIYIMETLERIHRPHWPKKRGQQADASLVDDETLEESMRFFRAGIE